MKSRAGPDGWDRRGVMLGALGALSATSVQVRWSSALAAPATSTGSDLLALSRALSGLNVSEAMASAMLPYFVEEPWGEKHIRTAWRLIKTEAGEGAAPERVSAMLKVDMFPAGEAWFLKHLTTTLYTGVYYHQRMPATPVLVEQALVHQIVDDLVTTPGSGELVPGYWADAPQVEL